MQKPLEIDFRNIHPSASLSAAIRKRVAKLEQHCPDIIGCRVTVEKPHHHQNQGAHFAVHIRVTVPGTEIVVSREPEQARNEDAMPALHDAFDADARQVEDYARTRRGKVKRHSLPPEPSLSE